MIDHEARSARAGRPDAAFHQTTLTDLHHFNNRVPIQIARLGGYLARASDPPPGNTVMWRGWSGLMDTKLGAAIADPTCG
jgi:hypothetical protein